MVKYSSISSGRHVGSSGNITKTRVSYGYWNSKENQRLFLNELKQKLKLKSLDDWLTVSTNQIIRNNGKILLNKYGCLFTALKELYPSHPWRFFSFVHSLPLSFWEKIENQQYFFDQLYYKLKCSRFEELLHLTIPQLTRYGGAEILRIYDGDIKKALCSIYHRSVDDLHLYIPHYHLNLENQHMIDIPSSYWENEENCRHYLQHVMKYYGFTDGDYQALASLSNSAIIKLGGKGLLLKYNGHLLPLLLSLYPDINWSDIYFHRSHRDGGGGERREVTRGKLPKGFWDSVVNQRVFMDYLFKKLMLRGREDWYDVKNAEIHQHGGSRLLSRYPSLFCALQTIYPESSWNLLLHSSSSKRQFWNQHVNISKSLLYVQRKFGIKKKNDWYRLSVLQLRRSPLRSALFANLDLISLLRLRFPNEKWEKNDFNKRGKKSVQFRLLCQAQLLYPQLLIVEEYKHPLLPSFRSDRNRFEIDVYIPALSLGFEYHGQQHYDDLISGGFSSLECYNTRDLQKLQLCKQTDLLVITIPYWWNDHSLSSLFASLPIKFRNDRCRYNNNNNNNTPINNNKIVLN